MFNYWQTEIFVLPNGRLLGVMRFIRRTGTTRLRVRLYYLLILFIVIPAKRGLFLPKNSTDLSLIIAVSIPIVVSLHIKNKVSPLSLNVPLYSSPLEEREYLKVLSGNALKITQPTGASLSAARIGLSPLFLSAELKHDVKLKIVRRNMNNCCVIFKWLAESFMCFTSKDQAF